MELESEMFFDCVETISAEESHPPNILSKRSRQQASSRAAMFRRYRRGRKLELRQIYAEYVRIKRGDQTVPTPNPDYISPLKRVNFASARQTVRRSSRPSLNILESNNVQHSQPPEPSASAISVSPGKNLTSPPNTDLCSAFHSQVQIADSKNEPMAMDVDTAELDRLLELYEPKPALASV